MPQIRRRKPEEEGEINITPMLDIVFIMLIFFIVTTSFVKEPGISPSRPFAQTAATKERGNIMIAVSRDDHIWMNKNRVELTGVRQMVEAARAENPESSVIIVADQSASTGMVIDLMDQVRVAGVTSIALAAEGEE
ncbi:MAG: biopolymer transporter ExbD [Gammaproteobacteria bacterium]|nr:biopolymer transporter ExbD [Gammaproteobacteria bacterium]MCY3987918.1 biopolymer transporter ExbD [Gammaproteobacteria bacterium]MDE0245475.1 biopolymer transporter ExbD [Gammaproteobacteria bacterium]MDE0453825.1 biopolymer transporter ExbD [Gammaproteobacteria bacterium]MDE0679639.1 biopolymer transporter ExbD [Gammaproteobacteria bacterium]